MRAKKREQEAIPADLNAVSLKAELWDTLQKVKAGKVTTATGDIVAAQAREILRTVKTQLSIFAQSGDSVSKEVVQFAKPVAK
jgi:hypothetical protein